MIIDADMEAESRGAEWAAVLPKLRHNKKNFI